MSEQAMEKVCPECAETVKAGAQVCRFCGFRFDGHEVDDVDETRLARHPLDSAFAGRGMVIWGLASAALAVIGAFGPWVNALGVSVSGTNGSSDGWIVVALMIIGALYFYGNRNTRRAGFGALIVGGISTFATVYDRENVSHLISNGSLLTRALVQIGWGLNLAAAASLSLAICGLVWTRIPGD